MDNMMKFNTPYDRACDAAQAARERRLSEVQPLLDAAQAELERRLLAARAHFEQATRDSPNPDENPYLDACDAAWNDYVKTRDTLLHPEKR